MSNNPTSDRDPANAPSAAGGPDEDFATLFAAQGRPVTLRLHVGDKVQAKIIHIGAENVFCELSPTQEGVMSKIDLADADGKLKVQVGDRIEAFVVSTRDGITLSRKVGRDVVNLDMLMEAAHTQMPIEGLVTGVNKGGIEVAVGGARGFCPIGQVDVGYVTEPQSYVGKTLQFLVKEVGEKGRNVVLSRRALLEAEQRDKAQKLRQTLAPGQRIDGKVTRLAEFGAFVDIGGIEGLIPISELSHVRVEKVSDVIKEGDAVTVEILRIEDDPKRPGQLRIGLSLKAAQPEPFVVHAAELVEGATFEGKVASLEKYGAFVEVFPGLQGLVHVSEISNKRVRHPSDVLKVGEAVTVRVLGVEPEKRRISLSIKAAAAAAAGESTARDEHGKPAAPGVGQSVEGTVDRIERFGVFVKLANGASALLPSAETGTPPGTDLERAFPKGSTVAAEVIAVDERGRIKISKRARDAAEERSLMDDYNKSQGGTGKGFGTLGDFLKSKKR